MNTGSKGDSLLSATIDEAALASLVANKGAIIADGGLVIMTAKAAGDILSAQVNNAGLIQARTISDLNGDYQKGEILLYAYDGTANIAGTLDASAPLGGDGGFIETSGDSVNIADGTMVTTLAADGKTGMWLIDPVDYTIAASGGNITGTQLSANLGTTNQTIEANDGSIYVNDKVEWAANTTLTLTAENDIFINNAIKATGLNAGLVLNFGGDYTILTKASYSGVNVVEPETGVAGAGALTAKEDTSGGVYGSITLSGDKASLEINGEVYTLIQNMDDFSLINANPDGYYALAQDITSTTDYTDSVVTSTFTGTFAGLGNAIDGLTIDSATPYTGLFGTTGDGVYIRDLGLTNVDISSSANYTGALIGLAANSGNIYQVYATGVITLSGNRFAGGLIGQASIANNTDVFVINSSYAGVDIAGGSSYIGGLLGAAATNINLTSEVNIYASHATGNITPTGTGSSIGGLVGYLRGNADACYASGNIILLTPATYNGSYGGLIGSMGYIRTNATLQNSFATGNIGSAQNTAISIVGGLVGELSPTGDGTIDIYNCYATGNLYVGTASGATASAGGLVGQVIGSSGGAVTFSYVHTTGDVTAGDLNGVGGLIGYTHFTGNVGSLQNMITVQYAYASGNVTSSGGRVGGLVGNSLYTNISNSYATGNIAGSGGVGGLVGQFQYGTIDNCYASGNVTGGGNVGGLVGRANGIYYVSNPDLYNPATINNSHASGDVTVTGSNNSGGGLVGSGSALIIADSSATGSVYNPGGGTGLVGYDNSYSPVDYQGTNTYTDVKAEAARSAAEAAYAAYRQENINSTNAVSNTTALEASNLTEKIEDMALVASSGKEQQYIEGLPGGIGYDASTGSGRGWGSGENGEAITMAMLGKNLFSAHVKMIITDEGDVYEFEEETAQ